MSGDNSCSNDVPNKYSGFEEGTFRSDAKTSSRSFLYWYQDLTTEVSRLQQFEHLEEKCYLSSGWRAQYVALVVVAPPASIIHDRKN